MNKLFLVAVLVSSSATAGSFRASDYMQYPQDAQQAEQLEIQLQRESNQEAARANEQAESDRRTRANEDWSYRFQNRMRNIENNYKNRYAD